MTTATVARRSTNCTGSIKEAEQPFYDFLEANDYPYLPRDVEREQFPTGHGKSLVPDVRLRKLPWGDIPPNVKLFLELTRGDFFTKASQLDPAVLAKNLASGDSGVAFLESPEYLRRKLLKIHRAESRDRRLVVILLTDELQQRIMADPDLLRKIIQDRLAEPRQHRHSRLRRGLPTAA
jgi:hypothetical protein